MAERGPAHQAGDRGGSGREDSEIPLSARVFRACNTAAGSENRIHDDPVAERYGFRGGLVPGTTVYAYLIAPLVERFADAWLESGSIRVRFAQPFYDAEEVVVRGRVDAFASPIEVALTAERSDGTVCATGLATVGRPDWFEEPRLEHYPRAPVPDPGSRPETLAIGASLGTLTERVDLSEIEARLDRIGVADRIYRGPRGIAHPLHALEQANRALMVNFKLGPWVHTGSEVVNLGVAYDGDELSARGRIADRYERKGHEIVVLDLLFVANGSRLVQQVRHNAIYRLRSDGPAR